MANRYPRQSATGNAPASKHDWQATKTFTGRAYLCSYCDNRVASVKGFSSSNPEARIRICPLCCEPTYFTGRGAEQIPGVKIGETVQNVPPDIDRIYEEARACYSVSGYTAAVMLCRKVLMNVAVAEDAEEGKTFAAYVDYLGDNGFVPPKGRGWIDHIRTKGNEANHEIPAMTEADAQELIHFTGMLLKFIYELPARLPAATVSPE
ncbi:hypothetical protein BH23GEM9_BH23GEM9_13910 [soil metagenome]